jgi:dTDP-4-dehydrorhamnose reductase
MWWITGSRGLLGKEICKTFNAVGIEYYATDYDVDITSSKAIHGFLKDKQISGIINCAAYTNVEAVETATEEQIKVNIIGPHNLSMITAKLDIPIIHFSTDYVFPGNVKGTPYTETSTPKPINKYGLSKLYGDLHIIKNSKKYYILRISWLYGGGSNNFIDKVVDKMLLSHPLTIVNDQVGSLTNAFDIARLLCLLVVQDPKKYGLYNFSGYGAASWFDVAQFIGKALFSMSVLKRIPTIEPISSWNANLRAKRPVFSYLSKQKIETELGVANIDWRDSLMSYLYQRFESEYGGAW